MNGHRCCDAMYVLATTDAMEKLFLWMGKNGFETGKAPKTVDDLLRELSCQVKDLRGKVDREEYYPN